MYLIWTVRFLIRKRDVITSYSIHYTKLYDAAVAKSTATDARTSADGSSYAAGCRYRAAVDGNDTAGTAGTATDARAEVAADSRYRTAVDDDVV